MSAVTASPEYTALLQKAPPKIIHSDKENEAYTEVLLDLDRRSEKLTKAERQFSELLTLLIEDYEEKRYPLPKAKPTSVIRFLMDQHGLNQKDLTSIFGTASVVSEVLNGKRELNKDHIERLSARFHVSPEVFF